jgi:hypothetical protein
VADVFLSAGVRTPFVKAGGVYARRSALELSIPTSSSPSPGIEPATNGIPIRGSPSTELHGIGSDQMHKKCESPLVIPCKFRAVTNSARHSCTHLAASCAIPDN